MKTDVTDSLFCDDRTFIIYELGKSTGELQLALKLQVALMPAPWMECYIKTLAKWAFHFGNLWLDLLEKEKAA